MKELRSSATVLCMKNDFVLWPTLIRSLHCFCCVVFPGDKQTAGMKADLDVMWKPLQQAD
ncbi:hypothetical protein N7451_012623 [Penicillium sp. IBT 35674x]|nr:hypothetical protein N7451_012623 [Penicillium sp. IBT 35674x]